MVRTVLDRRLAFDKPTLINNSLAVTEQGWQEVCSVMAGIRYLRGSEVAQAARLSGRQPVVVTIWALGLAMSINGSFRGRVLDRGTGDADTWDGEVMNVHTVVPTDDRQWLEITGEIGGPT